MCGIAGIIAKNQDRPNWDVLQRMADVVSHRGPDAGGVYVNAEVGLCHRRLSIIDLSDHANQPMESEDSRFVISYNGEIYNFREIRDELVSQGHAFRTNSDTEVLLRAYIVYGQKCLDFLNGMFAFAIWDNEARSLFLARDRLGKKPLYIYEDERLFAFASEIKSILQIPGVDTKLRMDAVKDFFFHQYVPDPKSIFARIEKLPPGWLLTRDATRLEKRKYWDVSFSNQRDLTEEDAIAQLQTLLQASVERRLVSDVPLGSFLSGGVDSSAIVAAMSRSTTSSVKTCAIGFGSSEYDEVAYARQVAERFGTDHVEYTVRESVPSQLESITSYFDEPFADQSFVPTFFVSKLAKEAVSVALTGDGGDENFAGYAKYSKDVVEHLIRGYVPEAIRSRIVPHLARLAQKIPLSACRKGATLLNAIATDPGHAFFLTNSFFRQSIWDRVVTGEFAHLTSDYSPAEVTASHYQAADTEDHLSKLLYTDIKTYLPGDILVKVDRMSMANSLETRAPLLDYELVEFAASLPSRLKINKGERKYILKKSLEGEIPRDILYRPKMGFSVPLASWLRQELKASFESHVFASHNGLQHFFKMDEVKLLWAEHLSGKVSHANELWSMLVFELWWQRYIENPAR